MAADTVVTTEDVVPVRSRISWGAIIGGSVLAMALYFLLTLLGTATGLSISGHVTAQSLGIGATVYAVIVTVVCLFVGGYYASRFTAGENAAEGAIYGILVWAVVFGVLVMFMATGVRTGFNAMMGVATTARAATDGDVSAGWEDAARRAGVPQEKIDEWRLKAQAAPAEARHAAEDPQTRQAAADAATRVTWYTFFGAWLSMAAAALGGYVGAGPSFRLVGVANRHDVVRRETVIKA
jgi:hypothetical protein